MGTFVKLTRSELRLAMREPMMMFFTVAFPTILIVILGSIPSFREHSPDVGGARVIDLYVPITVVMLLGTLGLQTTPQVLASYREKGVLRRFATTPAHPGALLGAQLVMSLIVAVFSTLMVLLVGRFAFDVPLPGYPFRYALCFLLSMGAVFAVGIFVAAVAPTGKAAAGIGMLLFFPLMFFAGLWSPREVMPTVLQRIADLTPVGAAQRALHDAAEGNWPALISVIVLVAYIVAFGSAATKLFRWE